MDKIFRAFADKNRRKILTILKNGESTVGDLVMQMDINQGTVSSHLAILRKSNLISCRVMGKKRLYKLNSDILGLFVKQLGKFFEVDNEISVDELILRR